MDDSEAEHVQIVRSNIRDALANPSDPDMHRSAFDVWYGQFDHPYDGAYCEAVSELAPLDKKALLAAATQGADQDSPFIGVLILELAGFNDPAAGPLIARWTALPPRQCAMRQDAIGGFALAHIALARLACPLPQPVAMESDVAQALVACGHILYWLNRIDLPIAQRRAECRDALAGLCRHQSDLSAAVICEFSRRNSIWIEGLHRLDGPEPVQVSIEAGFPNEAAEICRHCLNHPDKQRGYFDWVHRRDVFDFAIDVLGEYGAATDIRLLRIWSHDADVGKNAVKAIAQLEEAQIPVAARS